VRIVATASLAVFLLILTACGGGTNSPIATSGPLNGNWQLDLLQEEPRPATPLSVSGFVQQSRTDALTGSVALPTDPDYDNCGGVGPLDGTISGQNVSFTVNQAGTILDFTGTISPDNTSMSGDYQAPGGGCFTTPTTGTWNAFLIPPISGSFTGTLANSAYMSLLTGVTPPAPVSIAGTLTQSANVGSSSASVTGTITAVGYPCFSSASVVGTVSGQNVLLAVYGYTGEQIGSLGIVGDPTIAQGTSSGVSLTGSLILGGVTPSGKFGPCPAIGNDQVSDTATAQLQITP
jgi:hypothetical protein